MFLWGKLILFNKNMWSKCHENNNNMSEVDGGFKSTPALG